MDTSSRTHRNAGIQVVKFQNHDLPKIPTKLCYCSREIHVGAGATSTKYSPGAAYSWGLQVNEECKHTKQYFKLLLDPDYTHDQFNDGLSGDGELEPLEYAKMTTLRSRRTSGARGARSLTAERMVKDFLAGMLKDFYAHLHREYPGSGGTNRYSDEDFRIEWVFTVPAFYSPEMIGKLKDNILPDAGFVGNIHTVLEPEAAATHVLIDVIRRATVDQQQPDVKVCLP